MYHTVIVELELADALCAEAGSALVLANVAVAAMAEAPGSGVVDVPLSVLG